MPENDDSFEFDYSLGLDLLEDSDLSYGEKLNFLEEVEYELFTEHIATDLLNQGYELKASGVYGYATKNSIELSEDVIDFFDDVLNLNE